MIRPPWGLIAAGVLFGLLLLALRWPAVQAALAGTGRAHDEKNLVTVLLPRGMAAGVLALMPQQAGVAGTEQLPVLVFSAVLTTILIFAAGFPYFKKRLAAVGVKR
jgi:NhaP-type Na+/H+ or K+/H+ antiporter